MVGRVARAVVGRIRGARNELRLRRQRLYDYAPKSTLVTTTTDVPVPCVPAIDVHNHLGTWINQGRAWMAPDVGALLAAMDELRVEAVVNLDGRWGSELEANLDRYDRAHPGRFATFCQLDWALLREPGGPRRLADLVCEAADRGATGVKVWKDLGLGVRDGAGRLVQPDDPRLVEVWAAAAERKLPVLIHTADPVAFWQPVDRHNERLEELVRHPDWHHGSRPVPAHAALLDSFERLLERNRATTFVGAHLANSADDLRRAARMLAEHPNLVVDVSACEAALGRQPRAARSFFVEHSDRVLWGTDAFGFDVGRVRGWFRLFESADEYFPYSSGPPEQGRWTVSGLDLPADVLQKVYAGNARRVVPALRDGGAVR